MSRLLAKLAIAGTVAGLLSNPIVAQILPPEKRAQHVEITKAPELELAHDDTAIVRWTTTNPRGDDEHYGPRSLGSLGRDRDESRFQGDDEHYGPRSLGSMGRDRDEEGRFASRGPNEGRGQRGWYGEPEARSGGRGRPREYDEDERYRSPGGGEGRGRSGWYGDPEGHSEASRRGWDRR